MSRVTALRTLAVVLAVGLWGPGLGLVHLLVPWFRGGEDVVPAIAYGAVAAIVAPAGLLAQLRSTARGVAGLQAVAASAVGLLVAAPWQPAFLVVALVLGAGLVALLRLHPEGGVAVTLPEGPSRPLLALALAAAPFLLAATLTEPAGTKALAVTAGAVALVSALRPKGWALTALAAAAAVAVWGLAVAAHPRAEAVPDERWGVVALAWSLAFAGAVAWERRSR